VFGERVKPGAGWIFLMASMVEGGGMAKVRKGMGCSTSRIGGEGAGKKSFARAKMGIGWGWRAEAVREGGAITGG
jgi:hypothetical protein